MTKFLAKVMTAYPEMFPGPLNASIAGKALDKGIWQLDCINLRDFADNPTKRIDDSPFGGGSGMVITPNVVDKAIDSLNDHKSLQKIYLSCKGEPFNQNIAKDLSESGGAVFLCGRFEGVDERAIKHHNFKEISLGDFVLSGGEIAAMTVIDACVRLLPDVMGNPDSLSEESFNDYLLEYPHYTRPAKWLDYEVPAVLTEGHHAKITAWRRKESEKLTKERRPDLWQKHLELKKANKLQFLKKKQ